MQAVGAAIRPLGSLQSSQLQFAQSPKKTDKTLLRANEGAHGLGGAPQTLYTAGREFDGCYVRDRRLLYTSINYSILTKASIFKLPFLSLII